MIVADTQGLWRATGKFLGDSYCSSLMWSHCVLPSLSQYVSAAEHFWSSSGRRSREASWESHTFSEKKIPGKTHGLCFILAKWNVEISWNVMGSIILGGTPNISFKVLVFYQTMHSSKTSCWKCSLLGRTNNTVFKNLGETKKKFESKCSCRCCDFRVGSPAGSAACSLPCWANEKEEGGLESSYNWGSLYSDNLRNKDERGGKKSVNDLTLLLYFLHL